MKFLHRKILYYGNKRYVIFWPWFYCIGIQVDSVHKNIFLLKKVRHVKMWDPVINQSFPLHYMWPAPGLGTQTDFLGNVVVNSSLHKVDLWAVVEIPNQASAICWGQCAHSKSYTLTNITKCWGKWHITILKRQLETSRSPFSTKKLSYSSWPAQVHIPSAPLSRSLRSLCPSSLIFDIRDLLLRIFSHLPASNLAGWSWIKNSNWFCR